MILRSVLVCTPSTDSRGAGTMRKLTFGMNLSLDGYIAAPGDVRRQSRARRSCKIPVSGSPLEPGTSKVFVDRAGGEPDGIIVDEHDNLWIACNQSDEVMVLSRSKAG